VAYIQVKRADIHFCEPRERFFFFREKGVDDVDIILAEQPVEAEA
jgi:hypothetical protein